MNCTRAKSEIALWAGGDLDDRQTAKLERHVAVCPDCREYRQRMSGSLQVLQNPVSEEASSLHDSVWPGVESRLAVQSQIEARRAERLNRWLPAAAIAAACLAVIAFTTEPARQPRTLQGQVLPGDLQPGESLMSGRNTPAVGPRPSNWESDGGIQEFDQNDPQFKPLWPKKPRMNYDMFSSEESHLRLGRGDKIRSFPRD